MNEKEIIQKFLDGNCTNEEAIYITRYLRENPAVLEEFLPEEEWVKYLGNHVDENEDADEAIYENIHRAIHAGKPAFKQLLFWSGAVAASLFILIAGFNYFNRHDKSVVTKETASAGNTKTIRENNSDKNMQVVLPDSTIITLAAGSRIQYGADYNILKRDVFLDGKAAFAVAKNMEKPFTVFCEKISTTALGTRFSVDGTSENTSVALYEGKVVVKKIQDESIQTYLFPGDEIAFDASKNIFEKLVVSHIASTPNHGDIIHNSTREKKNAVINTEGLAKKAYPETGTNAGGAFTLFRNQSLKTVLDHLADIYHVEINYPTEISLSVNIYLSVDTTQSIEKILQNIAAVNNLELKKKADGKFYISK